MGKYSEEMVDHLLRHLDGLDVLELIDYHPESLQRIGDEVRSWCPLCQDHTGRYLCVRLGTRQFESLPPHGPDQRGNLIDLFARCRRISFDEAMEQLAHEFDVPLLEGNYREELQRRLDRAEKVLREAELEADNRDVLLTGAESGFEQVIDFDPDNLRAHRGLFRVLTMRADAIGAYGEAMKLLDLFEATENHEEQVETAREYLNSVPGDLIIRERLATALLKLEKPHEAVEEFLSLADYAESASQFETALDAYRRVQEHGAGFVDVLPMIVSLLMARGKVEEARKEIVENIERCRHGGDFTGAARSAARLVELDPPNDKARLSVIELSILGGLGGDTLTLCRTMVDELIAAGHHENAAEALTYLVAERPQDTGLLELLIECNGRAGNSDIVEELEFRVIDLLAEQGEHGSARARLDVMLQRDDQNLRALGAVADVSLAEGKKLEAVEYLRRVFELHLGSNRSEEALALAGRIADIAPGQLDIRTMEVELLLKMGRGEAARRALGVLSAELEKAGDFARLVTLLEGALRQVPGDADIRLHLASALHKLGHTTRGEDMRKHLIEELLEAGDEGKAEEAVKELLNADPRNPKLRMELADLHARGGKAGKAREIYEDLAAEYAKLEQYHEQKAVMEKQLLIDPKNITLMAKLSDLCTELGDEAGLVAVAVKQVRAMRETMDFDGAIDHARMVLEIDKDNIAVLRELMAIHQESSNQEEAMAIASRLSEIFRKRGSLEEEGELLQEIVYRAPADIASLERLIEILRRQNERGELLKRVDQLLGLNSYSTEKKIRLLRGLLKNMRPAPELHQRLARLLKAAGRSDEMVKEINELLSQRSGGDDAGDAITLYEELLEGEPDRIEAREALLKLLKDRGEEQRMERHMLLLARGYARVQRLDDAIESYKVLGELNPANDEVFRGHAEALRMRGEHDAANRKLRELAGHLVARNKTAEAIFALEEVLKHDKDNHEVRRELVALRRELGQAESAARELGQLAGVLAREGDAEGAISAWQEAVLLQPDAIDVRLKLIEQLRGAGRNGEAAKETVRAAEKLLREGRHDSALELIDPLIEEDPSNSAARRLRARIFEGRGEDKRALLEYKDIERLAHRPSSTGAARLPSAAPAPVPVSTPVPAPEPAPQAQMPGLELLPEYDFESFVVGTKNKFAHATAHAVAEHPGTARNPLFLYSGVGLGKTHLLHAIANFLRASNPKIRIVYTSTEYFTTDLEKARSENAIAEFRNRYRGIDALLLDDVQFLAGRDESQDEFFHIFNMLHQAKKQIVVTSDRPPKDIARLDMRLRTRFGQGVIVEIQSPDPETRLKILRDESRRRGFEVPEDAIEAIAGGIVTNVRELKGALNLLIEHHELGGDPLTVETARTIVEKYYAT